MESEEHEDRLLKFAAVAERELLEGDEAKRRQIAEAVYAFDERGCWPEDIEIKSAELAIRIWAVVESVRRKGFPKTLCM